jgi:coenzyme PQQ precursor peptide PqqA
MPWSKPDFVEITLGMEATAYVNTDDKAAVVTEPAAREEAPAALSTNH